MGKLRREGEESILLVCFYLFCLRMMSTETNRNITESNTLSDVNKIDPQDLYISMEGLED